ncbi:hypothetical protein Tco_0467993 [Tanacetum coccineum]
MLRCFLTTEVTPGISPDVAALTTEVSELKNMMKTMLIDKQKAQAPAPVKAVEQSCVTCGGAHSYKNCPATDGNVYRDNIQEYVSQAAAANFNQGNTNSRPPMVANQIRPPGFPPIQNNQNRFNQNQGNNFNQNRGTNFNQNRGNNFYQGQVYQPPTSQPPVYQAQPYQAPAQQMQGVSKTDFENYVKANDAVLRNMQNQGQGLQNQMTNLTEMLSKFVNSNTASSSNSGSLPSNTVTNPKEDLKGITTRSGIAYKGPTIPTSSPRVVEPRTEVTKDTIFLTNNGITEDVQPPVIPVENQNPVSEPDVALTTGPFGDGGGDDRPPFTPHIPTDMLGFASLTKAKAPVKANLGGRKATTQFNLTPHMQSQRWADINAGIQQHLQKLYNTNKASLKATHWVINPETGTYDVETIRQGRPESITPADWDAQIAIWNDPEYRCEPETREYAVAIVTSTPSRDAHRLISEEMVRLAGSRLQQRVGWCPTTDEENNAIGSKGQASGGTFPELVGYLPGRARDVLNHRPLPQMPRTTPAMSKSLKRRTVSTKQSLGKVARERIPGELSPSNYPGRHVARDEYPQRHVAREGVKMSMGIVWNMLNQQKNMISTAATDD